MAEAHAMGDTSIDPTSHNLWLFEVVIAAGLGFGTSLIGAIAGGLVARLTNNEASS